MPPGASRSWLPAGLVLLCGTGSGVRALPVNNPDVTLHTPSPGAPAQQRETAVAVSPIDNKTVLASAVVETVPYSLIDNRVGYYVSTAGGTSWSPAEDFPPNGVGAQQPNCTTPPAAGIGTGWTMDPGVAIDRSGSMYIAHRTRIDPVAHIAISRSTNGGASWQWWYVALAVPMPFGDLDLPSIAVDNTLTSPGLGNMYCAWYWNRLHYIEVARKTAADPFDNPDPYCELWSNRQQIGTGLGVNLQVGPEGNVYTCWTPFTVPENEIRFSSSMDQGVTWSAERTIQNITGIWSGGSDDPVLNIRSSTWPLTMATDKQQPGRLWIAWANRGVPGGGGTDPDVYLLRSVDAGVTWTVLPVTQDAAYQFYPWMAVDPIDSNSLYIGYFQATGAQSCEFYLAHSNDGGDTWEYRMPVSDAPFAIVATTRAPGYGIYGEYTGTDVRGGRVYPVWFSSVQGSPVLARTSVVLPDELEIRQTTLPAGEIAQYESTGRLEFGSGFAALAGSSTICRATNEVRLTAQPGGECRVAVGSTFSATIGVVSAKADGFESPTSPVAGASPAAVQLTIHPNPFNPTTTIGYAIPAPGDVRLAVYDVAGRRVKALVHAIQPAGQHAISFDASDMPSGVYYCVLRSNGRRLTERMALVK